MKADYAKNTVKREMATKRDIEIAFALLRQNLERRIQKFGMGKHASPAESMGILLEEWKELIDAHQSNILDDFAAETLDVGVTAIWTIVSLVFGIEAAETDMIPLGPVSRRLTDEQRDALINAAASITMRGGSKESTKIQDLLTLVNYDEPKLVVTHANLERVSENSPYRSCCPACKLGTLLVGRDQKTFELESEDRCVLCGQLFEYSDIETLRTPKKP